MKYQCPDSGCKYESDDKDIIKAHTLLLHGKEYCDYFVKDGVCEGVDWCAYSEDLENCPFDPHKCGILNIKIE